MASLSSSCPSKSPPPLPRSPLFTPIPEVDEEDYEEEDFLQGKKPVPAPPKKKSSGDNRQLSVLLDNCRPSKSRDSSKPTSVVPLDRNYQTTPPPKLLHSLLRIKSPSPSTSAPLEEAPTDWKLAAHELSRKLIHATRYRDEALLEASRLRHTLSDLELKLSQLESDCDYLKKALEEAAPAADNFQIPAAVAEARTAVRILARSLSIQIRPTRIVSMLRLPIPNTATLLIYIESLLNKVFYRGFENLSDGLQILDPKVRCKVNMASYQKVKGLTWEEVLCKGTKYYSEGLSRFCDEKMGEIADVFGWSRGWSESQLQAFFWAAKAVWVVGLLGRCDYPVVTVMRVERGARFDGRFVEDVVVGNKVTAVTVRLMVAPGFYLYDSRGGFQVVKCRVVCGLQ